MVQNPGGVPPLNHAKNPPHFCTYQLCNCPGWSGIVYRCTLTISGEFSMSSAIESGLVIESFDMLASRPVIWPWKFRLVTWPGRDGLGRGSHAGRFAGSTRGHHGLCRQHGRHDNSRREFLCRLCPSQTPVPHRAGPRSIGPVGAAARPRSAAALPVSVASRRPPAAPSA